MSQSSKNLCSHGIVLFRRTAGLLLKISEERVLNGVTVDDGLSTASWCVACLAQEGLLVAGTACELFATTTVGGGTEAAEGMERK